MRLLFDSILLSDDVEFDCLYLSMSVTVFVCLHWLLYCYSYVMTVLSQVMTGFMWC